MSSHREAPEISKDPVADSTDVYAFRSPDAPDTVTIIANFIPLQQPNSGPNFFEFDDDVIYDIKIANDTKGGADIIYRFRFTTVIRSKKTFLYNTGPITQVKSNAWNRPQFFSVTRIENGRSRVLGSGLEVPPVNVGPRSTPNYADLANSTVHTIGSRKFFAGQRSDAFHVDLGSIFDLGGLRPLNSAHVISLPNAAGVNGVDGYNVHTIAIQVPISDVSRNGDTPTSVTSGASNIGVWSATYRQASRVFNENAGRYNGVGAWKQVSRLGNPLFNEVLVPMYYKDQWNHRDPAGDSRYANYVNHPELAKLLPVLYPGAFPNLAAYTKARADLNAILLTGIPNGVVPGFQNFTGTQMSDRVRLNLAIPVSSNPNNLGVIGGDLQGYLFVFMLSASSDKNFNKDVPAVDCGIEASARTSRERGFMVDIKTLLVIVLAVIGFGLVPLLGAFLPGGLEDDD